MKVTPYEAKKTNPKNGSHTFYMVEFRNPITGRPTRRRGFTGKREAKQKVINLIARLQQSNLNDNPDVTFDQVAEQWLKNKRHTVAGSTYCKYKSQYDNHLVGAFGKKKMMDITLKDCQKIVYQLADKYKRWDKIIGTFSSVFNFALKYGAVNVNPFNRVDRPKVEHDNKPKSYKAEQFSTFKQAIVKQYKDSNPKAFTFLWLISQTGVRKGEAQGLRWGDVDLGQGYINIKRDTTRNYDGDLIVGDKPKNKYSVRRVPIGSETIDILKKWRIEQRHQLEYYNVDTSKPNQLVFTSQKGGIMTPSKPGKWLNVISKNYDLPHITPHGLRHTYATLLATNDKTPNRIAEVLGHKDSSITTEIYIDLHEEENHDLSDVMENY